MEEINELSKEQSRQVCLRLAQLANRHKLTQALLAHHTGYKQENISRLFNGRHSPSLEVIFKVLAAINQLSGQTYTLKDIDLPSNQAQP